jgi:hypothetical protein
MALGQRYLDGGLALVQPVERGVEFVVIDLAKTEHFAKAGGRGGGRQRPRGGKLGDRIEDAADEQRQDEVAAAIAVGAEDAVKADLARRAEGCGDVAVGQPRVTVKASCSSGMTVPPLSTPRRPSTWAEDQSERLHRVRLRTLPSWR